MPKFFDIFSKKEQNEPKLKILADSREKQSLVPAELMELGFNVEFQQLPVADYIAGGVAVERKTVQDLKASIIDKRIFGQLKELKQFPKHLLVIEGINDESVYSGSLHENAVRGFLLSAAISYQTPIIFTQNSKDTAKYLAILAKSPSKKEISLRASKIALTESEQLQFIIEGFPGIGPVSARELLKKFKTIKNIANAPQSELESVLGKKSTEFFRLFHAIYEAE